MKSVLLFVLLWIPIQAAAQSGSWSSKSWGGAVSYGRNAVTSQPVRAPSPLPTGASGSTIAWRITTDNPPQQGLVIKLCSADSCIALPSLGGEKKLPPSFPAAGPFHFVYMTKVRGPVFPVLTIMSNEVTLNYHIAQK